MFNEIETWEQTESFESTSGSITGNPTSTETDSAESSVVVKEKKPSDRTLVEKSSTVSNASRRTAVDDNDIQEKDNMMYLINSTLSHLGLGYARQKLVGTPEVKKVFGNNQRMNETSEGLSGEVEDTLEAEETNWTLSKQKPEGESVFSLVVSRLSFMICPHSCRKLFGSDERFTAITRSRDGGEP